MTFTTHSEKETIELGEKIGRRLAGGEVIALIGDLGGGKTQFTKGLGRGLGIVEPIISPTFTIERIYPSSRHSREGRDLVLHHFDFYRLVNVDPEIQEGIFDLLDDRKNVVVIEWAYNLKQALPKDFLEIEFDYLEDDKRQIKLIPHGKKYESLIEELK